LTIFDQHPNLGIVSQPDRCRGRNRGWEENRQLHGNEELAGAGDNPCMCGGGAERHARRERPERCSRGPGARNLLALYRLLSLAPQPARETIQRAKKHFAAALSLSLSASLSHSLSLSHTHTHTHKHTRTHTHTQRSVSDILDCSEPTGVWAYGRDLARRVPSARHRGVVGLPEFLPGHAQSPDGGRRLREREAKSYEPFARERDRRLRAL